MQSHRADSVRNRKRGHSERDSHAPLVDEPGAGSLSRAEAARDTVTRRWDVVSPSATQIGRPDRPGEEVGERLRRLHEERHPAMAGHSERTHRLDKLRVTQALCNRAGLTRWQRDRVLGIMEHLDLEAFGSQRAVPKVALVAIRHVVDVERRRYLGLEDEDRLADADPEELERLYGRFDSITDDPDFELLCRQYGLDTTALNRLRRVLKQQLDEGSGGAAYGRGLNRDPALPDLSDRRIRSGE